ncbi:hypothetical protein NDU88_000007 [Pleurodeles waltl]|uniref:Uncharacterized protein n=1 Tax=Pleurodeles waltl TaxID=8319 RepID=A0AAV7TFD9_PLEWA|nr:hypothetical protein NDU88_000007 [Pleurodeles waltl]
MNRGSNNGGNCSGPTHRRAVLERCALSTGYRYKHHETGLTLASNAGPWNQMGERYKEDVLPPGFFPLHPSKPSKRRGQGKKTLIEIKEPLIKVAPGSDGLSGALDNSVATRRKERGSATRKERPQVRRTENLTRVEATSDTIATLGTKVVQNMPLKPKGWDKKIEKELKPLDWAKDSGNKFYSLTEESDLSSGEHSLSKSGSSVSSETRNVSSSNEPTVRQLRRQRKCTKIWSGLQEGTEFSTSIGSKTLKWDYSGIILTDTPTTSGQQLVNNNMDGSTGGPISSA